jgi:hypothetical protein
VARIEKYGKLVQMSRADWVDYAVLRLEGTAESWCELMQRSKPEVLSTWAAFTKAIVERFEDRNHEDNMLTQYEETKHEGERMADYNDKFLRIYLEIADLVSERAAVHRYMSSLSPRTKLDVRRLNPDTLAEAMQFAEQAAEVNGDQLSTGQSRTMIGTHTTGTDTVKGTKERRCWKCHEVGHVRRDCPEKDDE